MTETPYFPEPGDVVLFPGAQFEFNQTLRYVITGTAGDLVSFKAESHSMIYTYPVGRLREIGLTKIAAKSETTDPEEGQ